MRLKTLSQSGGRRASVGERAECRAAEWLAHHCQMTLIARNWRNPRDRREEIDLVFHAGPELVFVEVKARSADALVPGYHAVGTAKRAVLRRAVRAYLSALAPRRLPIRFDVVEVETAPDRPTETWTVRHFPGVPLFAAGVRR